MSFLSGLRRLGGNVLRGISRVARPVVSTLKGVRDTINRVRNMPVVGDIVRTAEQFIPENIRRGVGLASQGLDVADSAVGAVDSLARGDVRGAVSAGRQAFQGGQRLRRNFR